ncbi:unnamed protein product [Mucor hiemalis]
MIKSPTDILCRYASLNANSLVKSHNSRTQSEYIRYLKQQNFDIICFQESHASNSEIVTSLDLHFQANQTLWTKHVGIVSFSDNYRIIPFNTSSSYADDRLQLCKIEHSQNFYVPFFILNLYAPAGSGHLRREFFHKVTTMLEDIRDTIDLTRLIISGDFNYSLQRASTLTTNTSADWLTLLELYFYNTMTFNELTDIPTFQRSNRGSTTNSVIDYIYIGHGLQNYLRDTGIHKLNSSWSDHSLLHIDIKIGNSPTGPGLWRANPIYVTHPELQQLIADKVQHLFQEFRHSSPLSSTDKWDRIKVGVKKVIRNYGYQYVNWRQQTIKHLEQKRNRILRGKPTAALRQQLVEPIDRQLGQLQHELVVIAGLKAGERWREKGEKDAGYLKRLGSKRTTQQYMAAIKRSINQDQPANNIEEAPIPEDLAKSPEDMQEAVRQYYQQLYTLDHVDNEQIEEYLATIHLHAKVTNHDNETLLAPFTLMDLRQQVLRSPKQSSPGNDGLGYQYLDLLCQIPAVESLLLEVFNTALSDNTMPKSWKDIRVRLLPKKGDLSDLKNWRPISLINCDAKVFSRMVNDRLITVANKLIQPSQTGFMPGRFIGENGLMVHLLINQARYLKSTGIGLLLDQEKAYDRVNPEYLLKVMTSYGFDVRFLTCLGNLFFGNLIQVNVNGYMSPTVYQERGLRQGDPMSPVLFNLAMEPLLLSIQQDNDISGYEFEHNGTLKRVKTLAYADDICTIITSVTDYNQVQLQLQRYSAVSNAKFNQSKTEAFSLSGKQEDDWQQLLVQNGISKYYHNKSPEPFRYLGFYMVYTVQQRSVIQDRLLEIVKERIRAYSTRHLSSRGRVTAINTLIMTKIWYTLRILMPTVAFFNQLRVLIYKYVWKQKKPFVSYNHLALPISGGGVGLLNPHTQHLVLQKRHLDHIFSDRSSSLVQPLIQYHLSLITLGSLPPELSFFIPHLRKHDLNHPTSILQACYKAFDQFGFALDFSECTIQILLQLPLYQIIEPLPPEHWFSRHHHFPVSNLFRYSTNRNRMVFKVQEEFSEKPGLCRRLVKDILDRRTVFIKPIFLQHVYFEVQDNQLLEYNITSLIQQVRAHPSWVQFKPRLYRQPLNYRCTSNIASIPFKILTFFWSLPIQLQARELWFRVLCKKLPTASFLHSIGVLDEKKCRLCTHPEETFGHFVYSCPRKRAIWHTILGFYFPTFDFTEEMMMSTLTSLASPFHYRSSLHKTFYMITATTQYYIWYYYWQLIINKTPFNDAVIINQIVQQLRILSRKSNYD